MELEKQRYYNGKKIINVKKRVPRALFRLLLHDRYIYFADDDEIENNEHTK